jgi:hypothetical protein
MAAEILLTKSPAGWDSIGGLFASSSGATSSLSGLAAVNPYLGLASTVLSMFGGGSTKISGAKNENISGQGVFNPTNQFESDSPMIDFSEPLQVVMLGAGVVILIYAFQKFRK